MEERMTGSQRMGWNVEKRHLLDVTWLVLSRTFRSSGYPHKVTRMRQSVFPQAALIGLGGLQNFNFLLKKKDST